MKEIGKYHFFVVSGVLVLVTLAGYYRVGGFEFLNYDDPEYVLANQYVQKGLTWGSVSWAFTTVHADNWHPLTWLSHMLDCELFGLDAGAHHFMNVLFHLANTVLLFVVFTRMTGRFFACAFVAAVFALHPLHVESVAWVSERKDVLSTFFWLATMWAYLRYTEQTGMGRYMLVLVFMALGLMAKPMLVTLPFVLLLLDYWPLGRLRPSRATKAEKLKKGKSISRPIDKKVATRLVGEKIPLVLLAAGSCIVTFLAQQSAGTVHPLPLAIRITNAVVSYSRYIVKMFWPSRLAVFYPHPGWVPMGLLVGSGFFLVCVSVLAILLRRSRPWLLVGWLWYIVTLVPVIGLLQVGSQAMANRYSYIPLIGIFLAVTWTIAEITSKWPYRRVLLGVTIALVLGIMTICTWLQLGHWHNSVTLFEHTLAVTKNNSVAHHNLALALNEKGRVDEAIGQFRQALRLNPKYPKAHNNLGGVLMNRGETDEAIREFRQALRLNPSYATAHNNLAGLFYQQGQLDQAIKHWSETVRLKPDWAEAHNNLAWLLATAEDEKLRNSSEAVRLARRACELTDHKHPRMLDTLATAYAAGGEFDNAVKTGQKAKELAESLGQKELIADIENHLELYQQDRCP